MVIAEIGLSLALLSGAAVVVRSAFLLDTMNVGYDLRPLSQSWMTWSTDRDTVVRYADLSNQIVSRIRSLPDVADASMVFRYGLIGASATVYGTDGMPRSVSGDGYRVVSPSYVRTLRLRILSGRDFAEGVPAEPEVIVDQKTAQVLWPGVDPIGERIKLGYKTSQLDWVRVVGVVENFDDHNLSISSRHVARTATLGAIYYLPSARDSILVLPRGRAPNVFRAFTFQAVTRAKTDGERMPITLRHYLRDMAPIRLITASGMDEDIVRERTSHDFIAAMFSTFAVLGIGLAALGIYGIVSHSVAERKRELGVRIALGATARDVLHSVLREGNILALSGVAVGLLFTKYTAGWLEAFSREDDRYDATLFAVMAAALFLVAVLAALIPALRATRIDPVESLRSE
jgi:putative ABC transport system permease protein